MTWVSNLILIVPIWRKLPPYQKSHPFQVKRIDVFSAQNNRGNSPSAPWNKELNACVDNFQFISVMKFKVASPQQAWFLPCSTLRMPNNGRELARSFSKQILKRKLKQDCFFPDVLRSFAITLHGGSSINFPVTSVETIKAFSNWTLWNICVAKSTW